MKSNKKNKILFFVILTLFPLMGCAGNSSYGKLRLEPEGKGKPTIEQLVERWQDYEVYYSGVSHPESLGNPL